MSNSELNKKSLSTQADDIKARRISPVELTQALLDTIQEQNPRLNAYISIYEESALAQARKAEFEISKGHYRGPLHGIPMGLKDNLNIQNRVTTIGSKIHAEFVPAHTATAISRLLDAGITILGKHNLHEYALGVTNENPHHGDCLNPWNTDRIAGGSSGGAGSALASGMTIGTLGSDTSGSIRIPAAACGVVGLKPTYGLVSKHGCFPEAWSLDHVGPMATEVSDLPLILDTISGHDPADTNSLNRAPTRLGHSLTCDIQGKTIGINEGFFFADVDPEVSAQVMAIIQELEYRGARIKTVTIPAIEHAEHAISVIDTCESSTVHHSALRDYPQDYGDDVRFLLECGELPSAVAYLQAQQMRRKLQRNFQQVFQEVDVLMSPTLPIQIPNRRQPTTRLNGRAVDTVDHLMRLVGPANLLGLPALSLPCGMLNDMPNSLQIIGKPLAEKTVLDFGLAVENMVGFAD